MKKTTRRWALIALLTVSFGFMDAAQADVSADNEAEAYCGCDDGCSCDKDCNCGQKDGKDCDCGNDCDCGKDNNCGCREGEDCSCGKDCGCKGEDE